MAWSSEDEVRCRFDFVCPKTRNELEATAVERVRTCSKCDSPVYRVFSEEERAVLDSRSVIAPHSQPTA